MVMEEYYKNQFEELKKDLIDASIIDIKHNEDADEGLILILSNFKEVKIGFSSEEGSIEIK